MTIHEVACVQIVVSWIRLRTLSQKENLDRSHTLSFVPCQKKRIVSNVWWTEKSDP